MKKALFLLIISIVILASACQTTDNTADHIVQQETPLEQTSKEEAPIIAETPTEVTSGTKASEPEVTIAEGEASTNDLKTYLCCIYYSNYPENKPTAFTIGGTETGYNKIYLSQGNNRKQIPDIIDRSFIDYDDFVFPMNSVFYLGDLPGIRKTGIGSTLNNIKIKNEAVNAVCVAESKYCSFYVEDSLSIPTHSFSSIVSQIDLYIDTVRSIFGKESDIDQNGKVIFLITDNIKAPIVGYYSPADRFSKTAVKESNEGDILYISDSVINSSISLALSCLVHEFTHMTIWDNNLINGNEDIDLFSVSEGIARWSESLVTDNYTVYNSIGCYLSCTKVHDLLEEDDADIYGLGVLFISYLKERYGIELLKHLAISPFSSIEIIEILTGKNISEVYEDMARCLLATGANNISSPYYLPGLNDGSNGFSFSEIIKDFLYSAPEHSITSKQNLFADKMNPLSMYFLIYEGTAPPVFFSGRAKLIYLEI